MDNNTVERLKQFALDYASGYMFDPDGEQLSKDLKTPVKDILQEFDKIASNAEYISKEDYLRFTSRMNQYFGRILDETNRITSKIDKAAKRVSDELIDDFMDGNF